MPGKAAVVQSVPYDPPFLLSPENYPEPSYLSGKFIPIFGGITGFIGSTWHNWSMRRPFTAGIPLLVGSTLAGFAIATFIQNRNDAYFAERDSVFRHYISLHPEDFPAHERVLVGDMLKPWVPIRG